MCMSFFCFISQVSPGESGQRSTISVVNVFWVQMNQWDFINVLPGDDNNLFPTAQSRFKVLNASPLFVGIS
jgi:hypothetical protein